MGSFGKRPDGRKFGASERRVRETGCVGCFGTRPTGRKFVAPERRVKQTVCGLLSDAIGRPAIRGVRLARQAKGARAPHTGWWQDGVGLGIGVWACPYREEREGYDVQTRAALLRGERVSKDLTNAGTMRVNVSIAEVETDPLSRWWQDGIGLGIGVWVNPYRE